ncbi:hypothetical protein ACWIGW_44185 [Nocardia brasiliensis]
MNWFATYRKSRWIRREAALARLDPETMAHHLRLRAAEPGSWRTVTVRDRVGGPWWALSLHGPIRTVDISATCPACGRDRGLPRWRGRVQHWANPCGHRDTPRAVISEADQMILGARVAADVARIHNQHNRNEKAHA